MADNSFDIENMVTEDMQVPTEAVAEAPPVDAAPVDATPAAETVVEAEAAPEIDYRAESERLTSELAAAAEQREQFAKAFREAEDQRLRMEGIMQASGYGQLPEKPAEAPVDQQKAQHERYDRAYRWVQENIAPAAGALQADEIAAIDKSLAAALGVEADNPAVQGVRQAMMLYGQAQLQRVAAMLAVNNVAMGDNVANLSRGQAEQFVTSHQEQQSVDQQVTEAFKWTFGTGTPELGRHYETLGDRGKLAFEQTAKEVADELAKEIFRNPDATRSSVISWCNQNNRMDVMNDYLARFGATMKSAYGIPDAAVAAAVAAVDPAAVNGKPARKAAPAPGVMPSARQPVTVSPAQSEDDDPIGSMQKEESQWGR